MMNGNVLEPTNSLVGPMLTDLYQITMVYAYWKVGRHNDHAVFDLFFRKNPFHGEYTVFAGLEEALAMVNTFKFTPSDIAYLREVLPHAEDGFFAWLSTLDCSSVKVYAVKEGSIVFPRIPLVRIEGSLAVGQLLETPLLNLLNFASLITTNATRFKKAAGPDKKLLEFGLRRAQGPDGGLSASRYSYMAGFAGTSNVLAGKLHKIPIMGTHAHAFVQAHTTLEDVKVTSLDGKNFLDVVLKYRNELGHTQTNDVSDGCRFKRLSEGELAAFIAYAIAFPDAFLALVDTYDTLSSGVPNFVCVALALHELGHRPVGIRLDSGDLSYLSKRCREALVAAGECYGIDYFKELNITASNDINEPVLNSLNEQRHEINSYGIGTHLVTCQAQPALGMVYKLVEINGEPRIKLSQDVSKVTIPGRKEAFRLIGTNGKPLLDLMTGCSEKAPEVGKKMLCRNAFDELRRAYVTPSQVIPLHGLYWDGPNGGLVGELPTLEERRQYVAEQFELIREDVVRSLNPTPYKVSVSNELYEFIHELWMKEYPVQELD
uniref:Nicotinate phosphoribosyltransferase n=1 Tax=Phytophthora ramorum TaxID=164328 RepID=H3G920_PHYRM